MIALAFVRATFVTMAIFALAITATAAFSVMARIALVATNCNKATKSHDTKNHEIFHLLLL